MEKQLKSLSPTNLRIVLIATIVLLVLVIGAGFWLFRTQMVSYAESVSKAAAEANVSANDVQNLQKLETELKDDQVAINRTKSIVADSESYQYQNQIIQDLTRYAKAAGVTITGYVFTSDGAAPGGAVAAPVANNGGAPAGLKTTSVSITPKSPVNYKSFMQFIHSIELNLTKMQLTGISLSKSPDGAEMVAVNPLTIEVYTK